MLLEINDENITLETCLFSLVHAGALVHTIDKVDSCGRTAPARAVEYGWVDAVTTLLNFGTNLHERFFVRGKLPLFHVAIAGPASNPLDTRFLDVVRILH